MQKNLLINVAKTWWILQHKTRVDAVKTDSKRVVQKAAEATGDLIGNKLADKITSVGKSKEKEKNKESRRNLHSTRKRQWAWVLSIKCNFIV